MAGFAAATMKRFNIPADRMQSSSKTSVKHAENRLQAAQGISQIPWKNIFADAGVHQCCSLLKHHLQRAQEQQFLNAGSQEGEAEGCLD